MNGYDWPYLIGERAKGRTWPTLAAEIGCSDSTLRKAFHRYMSNAQNGNTGMRILGIDIETAPNIAAVWGLFKQNISLSQIMHTGRVMCFAYKWFSEPDSEVHFHSEHGEAHEPMILKAWDVLNQADAVVHYNGYRFDVPTLNREFLKVGLMPPSPYKQIDLLKTARQRFRFVSNKLDHLLHELNIGEKVRNRGFELWMECMRFGRVSQTTYDQAWAEMEEYNRGDIPGMETLYHVMLPWITGHPNHALYKETDVPVCPNCGSDQLQQRGVARTATQTYPQYQCEGCGLWCRGRFNNTPHGQNVLSQVK